MVVVLSNDLSVLPAHHGFQAWSDIIATSNFGISAVSARAALGGVSGSILQFYGGEYEFDNLTVRLHRERGRDRGVKIEYAKNLLALRASVSTERSFTGLFPFVKNEDSLLFLPERVLWVDNRSGVQRRVMVRDFTHDLGLEPSAEQLRAAAQSFLSANDINAPDISMDVDFVHLWQTAEYEEFRDLERVALCDTVTVRHPDLGVCERVCPQDTQQFTQVNEHEHQFMQQFTVAAKVIRTVYDTLRERYRRIIIGSAKSNMAAVLGSTTMWWRGSAVAVSSTAELKEDIAPAPTALEKIARTGIYQYNYVGEAERASEQSDSRQSAAANRTVGFVIGGDCTLPPAEIIAEDGESVNLYAAIAMAWKGIQELTAKVADLEERLSAYENNPPPNARQPA